MVIMAMAIVAGAITTDGTGAAGITNGVTIVVTTTAGK
jgi:hypothetical protein